MTKEFQRYPLVDFVCDWKTCISIGSSRVKSHSLRWIPPPLGVFKLNFDGPSLGNPSLSGFGYHLGLS